MARIRAAIAQRQAASAAGREPLLGPTNFIEISEIPAAPEITSAFNRLRTISRLGVQYEFLARYAKHEGLSGLELSIHVDDRAFAFVAESVEEFQDRGESNWRLSGAASPATAVDAPVGIPGAAGENSTSLPRDLDIFACFRFPLLHTSKVDMAEIAAKEGYADLMEFTWFCHNPRHGKPCGTCDPCDFAAIEGMAHRLPKLARWKGQFARTALGRTVRRLRR